MVTRGFIRIIDSRQPTFSLRYTHEYVCDIANIVWLEPATGNIRFSIWIISTFSISFVLWQMILNIQWIAAKRRNVNVMSIIATKQSNTFTSVLKWILSIKSLVEYEVGSRMIRELKNWT